MGGDHHHEKPGSWPSNYPKIPDYRIYKVEGVPELEAVQKHLASKGLKDPWLRNEVWRYDPKIWGNDNVWRNMRRMIFRGFSYGLIATIITIAGEKVWDLAKGPDAHGHAHH